MAASLSYRFLLYCAFAIPISVLCHCFISLAQAQTGGFSIELIHLDSPKSPFYNPNETPYQRLANAFHRSINRLNRFDPTVVSPDTPQAEIIPNNVDYLMNISLGSPPFEILVVADTGSDLIWTQCKPCTQCYEQGAPLFDPKNSLTYEDLSCFSRQCASLPDTSCRSKEKCSYSVLYGDGSFSNGNLAIDTVTLGSTSGQPVALREFIFGCGHNDAGNFDFRTNGVVGLGPGNLSVITQMGTSKFSYCLVSFFPEAATSSQINFGCNGNVSGPGVVSAPLFAKDLQAFYFLALEAISIGKKKIIFYDSSFGTTKGNIIIDTGTTLTFFPEEFHAQLLSTFIRLIDTRPIPDPDQMLDLCYNYASVPEAPKITVHFRGADVKLSTSNYYIRTREEVACFIFKGWKGPAIYGKLMQANFLIGYDIEKQTVSFKRTDCSKE